jgi:hypothetical protein
MKTIAIVAFATLCSVTIALCQSDTATISGRVTDPSGAGISGADVQVQNVLTGREVATKSNSIGVYVVTALQPGRYRVIVSNSGFKQIVKADVLLNVQDNASLNFSMTIGSVSEIVTVDANAALNINTTDAAVGTVVDRQFVENMPLNGRSFQSLIELTPGVVLSKATGVGQFSVDGQRDDSNYFSIDGVSANIASQQGGGGLSSASSGALPAVSSGGGFNNLVSIDAMEEFKIQTSTFAPEFGRTPGAQISIVTRSGTNQFHGTAFDYLRNSVFDARDWFTNYYNLPTPEERQNDFGGVLGGPILKDRLFFFFSFEGLRLRLPRTKTLVVPSTAARSSAPASIQPLLNGFPLPTSSDGPLTGVESASFSNPSTLNATSIRVDYALTNKINVFGRYNHAPSNSAARSAFNIYALSTNARTVSNVDTFTTGATVTFRPNLVNEFRFNFSRTIGITGITLDNFGGAVVPPDSYLFQGYPQANSKDDEFATYFLDIGGGLFVGQNGNAHRQQQLNFVDTVSWTLGSHSIKAGFDYRRLTPMDGWYPYSEAVIFSDFAEAISGGTLLAYTGSSQSSLVRPLFQNLSFFGQDTWRVTPNLTLTYGLRWDYNPPPYDTGSHPLYTATNLNDPVNAALAPAGAPLWNATHNNFAPRLAVAYNLRRTPGREMVLRGGAGIFYDLGNNTGDNGVGEFPYQLYSYAPPGTTFPLNATAAAPPAFTVNPPYSTMQAFDPHLKLPRVYQWNVSLQQSLGPNQSVSATYLGAAGRKLLRDEFLSPGLAGLNSNFAGGIIVTTNQAYSNYDALQLQYQRRLSRGLQVLTSYSWAHSLDNTSNKTAGIGVTPYYLIYNSNLDYSSSDLDVRHSFSTAITYNVPSPGKSALLRTIAGNWALDSLFRANSAFPINILTGADPWGLTAVNLYDPFQRPDVVAGVPLYLYGSQYPGGKAINYTPGAVAGGCPDGSPSVGPFCTPSTVRQGNLGHNALRGFGAWEEDLAIRREFPIHEQLKLQFRAELFNIFNHPNFGDPNEQLGTIMLTNPLFGLSTATLAQSLDNGPGSGSFNALYQMGGPRSIQIALKLIF